MFEHSFKSGICLEVLTGKLSYAEARRTYGIKGQGTIRRWVKQYQEQSNLPFMDQTNQNPQDTKVETSSANEDLQKKARELDEALKMAKLKITALETMIDIAETELNIEIRKKSGTKQ